MKQPGDVILSTDDYFNNGTRYDTFYHILVAVTNFLTEMRQRLLLTGLLKKMLSKLPSSGLRLFLK